MKKYMYVLPASLLLSMQMQVVGFYLPEQQRWVSVNKLLSEMLCLPQSTQTIDLEDKLVMKFTIPGIPKENIKIQIEKIERGHVLTVSASPELKKEVSNTEEKSFSECFSSQSFFQSIRLNAPILAQSSTAKIENGILYVTLPKEILPKQEPFIVPVS